MTPTERSKTIDRINWLCAGLAEAGDDDGLELVQEVAVRTLASLPKRAPRTPEPGEDPYCVPDAAGVIASRPPGSTHRAEGSWDAVCSRLEAEARRQS